MGIGTGMGMGLGPHRKHAICGKVCLHSSQFSQFCQLVTGKEPDPADYVTKFFRGWIVRYTSGDRATDIPEADIFDFWRDRWRESHPAKQADKTDITAKAAERIAANDARYGAAKR